MLTIEEAQVILTDHVKNITEKELIPLEDAFGRILAEDILAERDMPPFPRSPLDGYALKAMDSAGADREHPVSLKVVGNIYAGEVFHGTIQAGETVRLTTGAPIPDGADTIIRQEDTDEGMDTVQIYVSNKAYDNYCYQGEDYKAGTVLVKAGSYLNAGAITVLASLGQAQVPVYRKARVAVIATGDELIAPGETWRPGKIYDSNRYYVCSRLTQLNNPALISIHAADTPEAVAEEIRKASACCDFIITSGGVSVGEKDILHDVVKEPEARQLFWGVAIKPGSPTLAFTFNDTLVLSLSGNPFGAIANFELLGKPVMKKLTGSPVWEIHKGEAVVQNDYRKRAGARRFLRGIEADGKVTIKGRQDSGSISSMVGCNCFVEIAPTKNGAAAGDRVPIYWI